MATISLRHFLQFYLEVFLQQQQKIQNINIWNLVLKEKLDPNFFAKLSNSSFFKLQNDFKILFFIIIGLVISFLLLF